MGINLHDVVVESHVKHPVGLVENKKRHLREVHISHAEMCEKSSGSGDHHIGSRFESFPLLVVSEAIGTAIYSYAAHRHEVGESLKLSVNLLGKFSGRSHYHAVHGIRRKTAIGKPVDHGQQICGSLTGAGLCASEQIFPLQHRRYGLFLNRGAFVEMHIPESVENIIVGQYLIKSHCLVFFFFYFTLNSGN